MQQYPVSIYFSGAPRDGFQAYPTGFEYSSRSDTSNSRVPEIMAVDFLSGNRSVYYYLRYDMKTAIQGRSGSNFGIWVVLVDCTLPSDAKTVKKLRTFFREVFAFLIEQRLIGEDVKAKQFFYQLDSFDHHKQIDQIQSLIGRNFQDDFESLQKSLKGNEKKKILFQTGDDKPKAKKKGGPPTLAKPTPATEKSEAVSGVARPEEPVVDLIQQQKWDAMEKKANRLQRAVIILGSIFSLVALVVLLFITQPSWLFKVGTDEVERDLTPDQQLVEPVDSVSDQRPEEPPMEVVATPDPTTERPSIPVTRQTPRREPVTTSSPQETEQSPSAPEEEEPSAVEPSEQKLWTGDGKLVRMVLNEGKGRAQYYLNRETFCDNLMLSIENPYEDFLIQLRQKLADEKVGFFRELNLDEGVWLQWFKKNNVELSELEIYLSQTAKDNEDAVRLWMSAPTGRNKKVSNSLILYQVPLSNQ